MTPDRIAIATSLISHCEGLRLSPYHDVANLWSIGYGARWNLDGASVTARTPAITALQAQDMLRATLLGGIAPEVQRLVEHKLTEAQWGAVFSLAYNIGVAAFERSTILRYLRLNALAIAAVQFGAFVYAGHPSVRIAGLVARRALERAVFDGTVDPITLAPVTVPTTPHPAFTSTTITAASCDALNAQELSLLRGSTVPAQEAATS